MRVASLANVLLSFPSQNFMISNYQGQEAIDNDDGSAYYNTHHNFLIYSGNGMKNDFGEGEGGGGGGGEGRQRCVGSSPRLQHALSNTR
jgi:hypothetical protein